MAKTTATTPAVAKVKAVKRDVVDREMLRHVETQLHHAAKGFDAVSVLFQYLVNDVSTITITLSLHVSYSSPRLPTMTYRWRRCTAHRPYRSVIWSRRRPQCTPPFSSVFGYRVRFLPNNSP